MKKIKRKSFWILYNFLLPFTLIVAFSLRINFLSFVYFVFTLFVPLTVSPPTSKYPGHPYRFISVITFWAIFALICQLIFNFVPWENVLDRPILSTNSPFVFSKMPNSTFVDLFLKEDVIVPQVDCLPFSRWLRQLGFDKIRPYWNFSRTANLFASDILVLIYCGFLFFRLKYLQHQKRQKILQNSVLLEKQEQTRRFSQIMAHFKKYKLEKYSKIINNTVLTIFCCIIGAFHPSLASFPYFFAFIIIATFWAFNQKFTKKFWMKTRKSLLLYSAAHLCLIYIYQLPNVYKNFPQHEIIARIFGLIHYKNFSCDRITWPFPYQAWIWPEYFFPFFLFIFYHFLAIQISTLKEKEEWQKLEKFFGQSKSAVGALIMKSQHGTNVAIGYQRKTSASILDEKEEKEANLMQVEENPKKKISTSSTSSFSKKKFKPFAEKLAAIKTEHEKMKNFAKWQNLKPVLEVLMAQSYVVALIVLMAWSLCYHSWSTFVMLILSFLVWIHPNSQGFYVKLAPFIVGYATILLIFQFIYSLPLTQDELPDEHPPFLRQLGLEKPRINAPFFDILLKSIFNFAFWLALRQTFETRRTPKEETKEALPTPQTLPEVETESPTKLLLVEKIKIQISNFWIFLVLILLLVISMRNPVVFYRIVYMAFFLVFVTTFTVSFPIFRKILRGFWIAMIGYCIFVVTLIYTYQFHGIPDLYKNFLGMSEDVTNSIGLKRISSGQLLIRLLTPISFLIFTLIQLNFFHEKMMKITQKWEEDVYGLKLRFLMAKLKLFRQKMNYLESGMIENGSENFEQEKIEEIKGIAARQRIKKVMDEIEKKCKQVFLYRQNFYNIVWRLAEIHIDRIVCFLVVYIAIHEISSLNLPSIVCVAIMLPLGKNAPKLCDFISISSAVIVILKMLFQMEFIKKDDLQTTCFDQNLYNGTKTFDFGSWFGMQKVDSIFEHTKWHIFLIFSLVSRELIKIRQFLHRKKHRLEEPPRGIIFPGIERKHADENFFNCFFYFCNYFSYKFGVEISFIFSVIAIGIRNDIFAVFYVGWLIFLLTRTRIEQQIFWPKFTGFLAICFVFQYLLAVGFPGYFCIGYFWDNWDENLIEWLCLPSFKIINSQNTLKFFADFFMFVSVSSQYYNFSLELKHGPNYPGGSNEMIETFSKNSKQFLFKSLKIKSFRPLKRSTVPDFISDGKTMLDKMKHVFFMYFYWITLSMIFIAGTTHVTIFAAGYVFGCFFFLWFGYSFFFKPIIVILRMWDLLIFYNISVILLKTVLQLVGCVYLSQIYKNFCWLLQLLGIACNKAGYNAVELVDPEILAECDVPHAEVGIYYDNLLFVFLLIQRRIFGSEYFKHVISELKTRKFFASRGAELIEKIKKQEIEEAEGREKEMMNMVDKMVAKISKKHRKSIPIDEIPMDLSPEMRQNDGTIMVKLTEPSMMDIQTLEGTISSETLSPMSPEFKSNAKSSEKSLETPKRIRPHSFSDIPRPIQQQKLDENHRRKSEHIRYKSQDEESDSWSINSSEKNAASSLRKTTEEGGVKGLGPLQLLNFAIKKGAIKDAVKESNEMEKTHTQLQKEMEKNYGKSDYHSIRKIILKEKARQKAKPDFDEETFETDALTNIASTKESENVLISPTCANFCIEKRPRKSTTSEEDEKLLKNEKNVEEKEDKIEIKIILSKKQRLKQFLKQIKKQLTEYAKMLAIFFGMLFKGTMESLISYLMQLSRDYRYIAYILQEEKRIHKELFDQKLDVDKPLSKRERHQQRAMIREKLQEKYGKSGFLKDEGIRRLHQYVEETEVKEESQAFECPIIEIQHCDSVEENSDKIDGRILDEIEEIDENSSNCCVKSVEYAVIQPAIIVQIDEEGSNPKVVIPLQSEEISEEIVLESSMKEDSLSDDKSLDFSEKEEDSIFVRLVVALYYTILSRSELICYMMIILNHINSASLLSMPLPFMMFCWGTLTLPLPSKTFWITMISYTETMVVIKYIFQFGFFPWNHAAPSLDPFWFPRILGIEKRPKYAAWDLALLMTLFLHRNILLSIGLWKNESSDDHDDESSISSVQEEHKMSIISNATSLAAFPLQLKQSFPRRLTAISFNNVALKFQSEKFKKKWEILNEKFQNLTNIVKINKNNKITAVFDEKNEKFLTRKMAIAGLDSMINDKNDVKYCLDTIKEESDKICDEIKPNFFGKKRENQVLVLIQSVLLWIFVDKKMTKVKGFFGQVLNPINRVPVDVYAPMFLCDIVCFLIVIFGFSSFGTDNGAGSVAAYFEENKVPGTLVSMLIIQFVLIVIDRALFLRKFLFGKLCFQMFLVVFIHIWIFFLLPGATDRLFVNNFTCKLWYFVKSIYFLISAKQIRCGYPKFSVGNVLTRNYNYFNYVLKNSYMKVPFLYEMGLLTDWIWKDTSLNLGDWITLHDIYSNIARLKCMRNWEEDFPSPKGVKQRPFIKYGWGGFLLFLIILIIWFPLVLFSMANTVGLRSTPIECTCRLTIAGYQPLFDSTARMGDIQPLTIEEYDNLYYTYRMSKTSLSYIADYTNLDVVKASINGNSASIWQISPPAREYMTINLNSSLPMSLQFEWSFKRPPDENLQQGIAEDNRIIELPAGDSIRQDLIAMINGQSSESILIPNLFPSMVKIPGEGKADYASSLLVEHLKGSNLPIETTFNDVLLELVSVNGVEYWKLRMIDQMFDPIRKTESVIHDRLIFYGFVDKVFPKSFSFITGGGILGLYISIVFLLGQYIRGFVIDSMQSIMFEELPNVDRILDLCHKIFFVRDVNRFDLEEALYTNLVFLFRSPATLIKWTKERPT